jgi:CRP-like cAMP-binding protein
LPRQRNILADLGAREREAFLALCHRKVFEPGESVFAQGAPHAGTYVVRSGLIRTYYISPLGKEITLAFWSEGDWIGGPEFFGGSAHHIWSAEAVERSTTLVISGAELRRLAHEIPAVAFAVIEALTFKLHWVSLLLQILGTESVSERLAHLLVKLGETYGEPFEDGVRIRYPFSQKHLASMVGASRQWVSLAISNLQRAGILRIHKRHLVIVDPEKLRAVV